MAARIVVAAFITILFFNKAQLAFSQTVSSSEASVTSPTTLVPSTTNLTNPTTTVSHGCDFPDVPSLDEPHYAAMSLEEQYQELRGLRSRTLSLLPDEKAKLDDAQSGLAQIQALAADALQQQAYFNSTIRQYASQIDTIDRQLASGTLTTEQKHDLEGTKSSIAGELDRAKTYITTRVATRNTATEVKNAQTDIYNTKSCYAYLQDLSNRIEEKIVALLIPDSQKNLFKLDLSFIYAGIVSLLICGFFWIAATDSRVRLSIFSHEAGIQFITLFSLVIAIILFGILDVLKDKELAALLGGISGYILGRATTQRASPTAPASASRSVTGTTISFVAPDTIEDSGNRLGIFQVGDRIQVTGNIQNRGTFTVASVSAGLIHTTERIQAEGASATVTITAM
jgi:hypothetical protein